MGIIAAQSFPQPKVRATPTDISGESLVEDIREGKAEGVVDKTTNELLIELNEKFDQLLELFTEVHDHVVRR